MWLPLSRNCRTCGSRPRTETLPSDTRWWEFNDDPKWSALAVALGIIGPGLSGNEGVPGWWRRAQHHVPGAAALRFCVVRSIFWHTRESRSPVYNVGIAIPWPSFSQCRTFLGNADENSAIESCGHPTESSFLCYQKIPYRPLGTYRKLAVLNAFNFWTVDCNDDIQLSVTNLYILLCDLGGRVGPLRFQPREFS